MKHLFEQVTAQLVEQLKEIEAGRRPAQWFKPWTASGMPQFPTNQLTGAQYKGINAFILYVTAINMGYRTNQWLTFKQKNTFNSQNEAELKIVKGSHGYPVFKYVEWIPKDYQPLEGGGYVNTQTGDMREDPKTMALRKYTVFNLDQMEGIPTELLPDDKEPDWESIYEHANKDVLKFPCEVRHGALDKAYYQPNSHFIMMPARAQFKTEADYLATLFHEHVHSTGKILERDMSGVMGTTSYAKEELVAEIGSAMLCARYGIEAPMQHPEYIAAYMKQLQSSDRAFWNAANAAQKAVNYLTEKAA